MDTLFKYIKHFIRMREISFLIKKIIPLNTIEYRRDFFNKNVIDSLKEEDKDEIMTEILKMLKENPSDQLIISTLGYMKSKEALPLLYEILASANTPLFAIMCAAAIFNINHDKTMIKIGLSVFPEIKKINKWELTRSALWYLGTFKKSEFDDILKEYVDNPNVLLRNNILINLKLNHISIIGNKFYIDE